MQTFKSFNQFLNEASGNYGGLDANGHQIDYYATDWKEGKLAYISIINRSGVGWVLRKIGLFYKLEPEQIRQYNNEIQHMMLDNAIERNYVEVGVPQIASKETLTASGQLPKFIDDVFKLSQRDDIVNTLSELSSAINNDPNYVFDIANTLSIEKAISINSTNATVAQKLPKEPTVAL